MSLFDLVRRRRAFDIVEATVLETDPDGTAWAKPWVFRRTAYARVPISRRQVRGLGLKPGEVVSVTIDPTSLRVHSARRLFPEPRRDAER